MNQRALGLIDIHQNIWCTRRVTIPLHDFGRVVCYQLTLLVHRCSAFFPLVRLNQRRWFVSVLSANANHNVVSLGLTIVKRPQLWPCKISRIFILNPPRKRFLCRKKIANFHFQFMADGPPTLLRTMSLVRRGLMSVPP